MKTKPIPAIVMLSAGFVTCIIAIYTHMELMAFTKSLLLVLIVFYILGGIVKIILDKNFAQMKEEEEETADTEENPEDSQETEEETSEAEPTTEGVALEAFYERSRETENLGKVHKKSDTGNA